ncbi:MAG TPA: hypothetical protein VGR47_18795 [Terracidiphilus sp.]|nr:hypothetical protein [Terracidiphilus sp.]
MESRDNYNEIASMLLLSDVELGLTFTWVALSYPEGERRKAAIQRAKAAYRQISKLKDSVAMTGADRLELAARLEKLDAALHEAASSGHTALSLT